MKCIIYHFVELLIEKIFYSVGQIAGNYNLGGQNVVSGGNNDAYIVKYDSSGTFQWSKTFGGGSTMDANDKAQDIVIDSNDFIIGLERLCLGG